MIDEFVSALNQNSFIVGIIFQKNSRTPLSVVKIFDLLLSNPKLLNVDISENRLTDDSIGHFVKVLQSLPPNRDHISVVLQRNQFGLPDAAHLATALSQNVPIRWLDLRNHGPGC